MNILLVAGTLTGLGGIETCIRTVALEGRAHGDRVRVLALSPSTVDGQWHQGLDYVEVPNGAQSLRKQMLRGLPAIVRECRARPADVVVVIYSSTIPLVRLALMLAGLRRPVMSWLHFTMAHKQRTQLLRLAHGHLCISSEIADQVKQLPGVAPASVHVVYNGTRLEVPQTIPRSERGPLRLLYVGRLMVGRQKRTDDLLRSLAEVRGEWQLRLIGAGDLPEDIPALQALAEELGIADRLIWSGRQARPWDTVHTADLLVLCSAFEGFGMVLIEAMARGIPCISSDCSCGPSDIIQPGLNGWLYPAGDHEALVRQLQQVVAEPERLPAGAVVSASVRKFSSAEVFLRIKRAMQATIEQSRQPRTSPAR